MKTMNGMRASTLFLFALLSATGLPASAAGIPVTLYKNPNCGCCNVYVDLLKGNGFDVKAVNTTDLASVKAKFGVPAALEGCHTFTAGPYVFEGLVPVEYVKRVLSGGRPIKGVSLPGMPAGAPGMPGFKPAPLDVYYITDAVPPRKFASF